MREHLINLLSIITDERVRGSLIYNKNSPYDRMITAARKAVIASRPNTMTEDDATREDKVTGNG